jgi:hypothetical protein
MVDELERPADRIASRQQRLDQLGRRGLARLRGELQRQENARQRNAEQKAAATVRTAARTCSPERLRRRHAHPPP